MSFSHESLVIIGIYGNTIVDQKAKDALDNPISNCSIPYTDFKPFIVTKYFKALARQLGPANS